MNQQERNDLFNEFYNYSGLQSLFFIHEPISPAEDLPEGVGLSDEERLELLTRSVASREKDDQFATLPPLLRKIMAVADNDNMADILYLGSLAVLSACLPGVNGSWFGEMQKCNLYFFLTGAAASGKGRMKLCSYLIDPLNDYTFAKSQEAITDFMFNIISALQTGDHAGVTLNSNTSEPPATHRFMIPANSSAPAMYEDIARNDGNGLIFETEADTLALALRRGDFSDLLRKAFHGEAVSLRRKTHQEQLYVENPYLSICISGTPEQAKTLLKSTENGLFSRFLFYRILADDRPTEQELFSDGRALKLYFNRLGEQVRDFYIQLQAHKQGIEVQFSKSQLQMLYDLSNNFTLQYTDLYQKAYGTEKAIDAARSVARRMSFITFRIAMIRTALRLIGHKHLPSAVACNEDDFFDAYYDAGIFMQHALVVYDEMVSKPSDNIVEKFSDIDTQAPDFLKPYQRQLLNLLPDSFNMQELLQINRTTRLSHGTLFRTLNTLVDLGLLKRISRGAYKKISHSS